MNFRRKGNIARTISKVSLQPRHLEVISTSDILQGNTLRDKNIRKNVWQESHHFEQFAGDQRGDQNCEETTKRSNSPRERSVLAPALGAGGRRFESCHLDSLETTKPFVKSRGFYLVVTLSRFSR